MYMYIYLHIKCASIYMQWLYKYKEIHSSKILFFRIIYIHISEWLDKITICLNGDVTPYPMIVSSCPAPILPPEGPTREWRQLLAVRISGGNLKNKLQ